VPSENLVLSEVGGYLFEWPFGTDIRSRGTTPALQSQGIPVLRMLVMKSSTPKAHRTSLDAGNFAAS
jgi:hypothetical protein